MQIAIQEQKQNQSVYSLDKYQGQQKWCFAIVLNRAKDNFDSNPNILNESLLRFEKRSKQDWFDEETRELILENKGGDKDEYRIKQKIIKAFQDRLSDLDSPNNLRNYFSHFLHTEDCLYFKKDDDVRKIMEKTYEKAKLIYLGQETNDSSTFSVPLFENDKITAAGVILFASFFVEMNVLIRLLGQKDVKGFTQTEGKYNLTRKAISHYALRGSYSVPKHDTKMFRDVLGYLLRIPSQAYQHYHPDEPFGHKETADDGKVRKLWSERKSEKFISIAASYLEDFLPAGYSIRFGRRKIERPAVKEEDENKPHRKKKKVEVLFEGYQPDDPYYVSNNNVILEITDKDNGKTTCKVGVNELKYLVLLALSSKGKEAIEAIAGYVKKIENIELFQKSTVEKNREYLPRFILRSYGVKNRDKQTAIEKRVEYIREKWEEKKQGSKEARLDSKARDILRYINECCNRPLDRDEYNKIFEYLINKNFKEGFQKELAELITKERIEEEKIENLRKLENLEQIHQKVCEHVLTNLKQLEGNELLEYIGLKEKGGKKDEQIEKEKNDKVFKNKIKNLSPVLCKGFLREKCFEGENKKFWELVEDARMRSGAYDVLIDEKYYQIPSREQFDKTNTALWETKALDRLCMMMAWEYYKRLNERLAGESEKIEWAEKDKILLKLKVKDKVKTIRFSIRDFTKLYVMDEPDFLGRLFDYFIDKGTNEIEYHQLYLQGLNKYSDLQMVCMTALIEFEDKIIKRKRINLEGESHIPFDTILNVGLGDDKEKESIRKMRNSVFHHNIYFERDDLKRFYDVMKREGIQREWPLKV